MEYQILKGAVENTNEAFVTIDKHSTVVFFNKAAEQLFGYSRDEVIGQDLGMILNPMCEAGHRKAVNLFVETRKPTLIGHESELMVPRKNGETFPASISFSVAEVEGDLFFTGIIRDLTDRKRLETQLIQSERLASIGQAVAEISHEIKNPLLMIGGFARRLFKKSKNEDDQAKLRIITEEVERLEKLLADLKELYRAQNLQLSEIDINMLLKEVIALVEHEAAEKNIIIGVTLDKDCNRVNADQKKLKQVLLNLLKNSMEALSDGGTLSVKTRGKKDKVEIEIADTGAGMSEEVKKRIFAPFFTTKEHGTGLGLCISKRIIDDHPGSSFSLESTEGEGTVVTISLSKNGVY
jgi:PAS domain S-box-containing protein